MVLFTIIALLVSSTTILILPLVHDALLRIM